mgnify:CR=1 FL=1
MSGPHIDHGHSVAAWTAAAIVTFAFTLGTVAVCIQNWPLFWVSVVLVPVGGIAGKVLGLMGFGNKNA